MPNGRHFQAKKGDEKLTEIKKTNDSSGITPPHDDVVDGGKAEPRRI